VQADLSIRGSGIGETLVLLNGQRINDPQTAHHDMDIPVPLEAVARIETMRGSGSTMYGSDAAGGVVNIVTEKPERTEVRLRAAAGNIGMNQQSGSIAGGVGAVSERLVFSRDFSSGFMPDRDYRNLQLASMTHVSTGLGPADITLGYADRPFGADQFYGNFNSWEDTKTWFAGAQQAIGTKTTASFSYRRHSDLFVLYRDRPAQFVNRHVSETWQAAARRREPLASTVTAYCGAEAVGESISSSNLGDHSRVRGAIYGAIDFRALRRFSLSLSAREEMYRRGAAEFSPTAAGGVWLSPQWKLRASASRAFRVPSYTDLYYHDPGNAGSPDLRPERAWNYEAGADWIPGSWLRAGLTFFARRERDVIDYYRRSVSDIWRALNIQNLNFRGVEASLRLVPAAGHSVDIRYTGLNASQDTLPIGQTKYTFNFPRHSAVAAWQAALPRGLILRTRAGVIDRLGRNAYSVWDFQAASTRGRIRPFLQVGNLTATRYEEIPGVLMPGRTILGGVEVVALGR
jgi:iron complex outermembrane receptor protein